MKHCDRVVTELEDGWACELGPDCPLLDVLVVDEDAYVARHRWARLLVSHDLGGEA